MTYSTQIQHPEYIEAEEALLTVRDCVQGSPTVKGKSFTYLPHPSQVDQTSKAEKIRYQMYIDGAEFDSYPDHTRRTLMGKMRISDTDVELPDRLSYLKQDIDGDGLSLRGAIEYAVNNVLQTKWHFLVADYQGLSGVPLEELSQADARELNPRATIKQYTRENVINWNFSRVNGVMQLSYVKLREVGSEFDPEQGTHIEVNSYLVLALDEEGNYYQQKTVEKATDADVQTGERDYVTVSGAPLKYIPYEILCDEELEGNGLPIPAGFLYPVCDKTLHRYRVSALYKETQRGLSPTSDTSGWKQGDMDLFKEVNQRDYIATGPNAVNNLPENVTRTVTSCSADMTDFQWYFTENDKQIRALGGSSPDSDGNVTATEAQINAGEQNAIMVSIADNAEAAFKRLAFYCGMFEGIYSQEDMSSDVDDISIEMPRDFATPRLTVEEVQTILQMVIQGIRTREQAVRQLAQGGWDYQDAETTISELEEQPPPLGLPPIDDSDSILDNTGQ